MLIENINLLISIPTCKQYTEVEKQLDEIKNTVTIHPYRLIASCQPFSASINGNLCLDKINDSNICIMMDDDITGFYKGWDIDLIKPLIVL